jgi:predicted aspartyl protease
MNKLYYSIIFLVLVIFIFVFLSYYGAWRVRFGIIKPTKINSCTLFFSREQDHIILKSSRLLWDTGAVSTLLFDIPASKKKIAGYSFINESFTNKSKFASIYFSEEFQHDSLRIENLYFSVFNFNKSSKFVKSLNISGILGMDVISASNWLIDFGKERIEANNLFVENEHPVVTIFFSSLEKPNVSITIDDSIKIDNILFDTGSTSYLKLLPEDIQHINKVHNPVKEYSVFSAGLYSDSISEHTFLYNQMKINGFSANLVTINQSSVRLIGLPFLKQFDKVFFDSHNKRISFYKKL